jgi:hypothetical protein
MSKFLGLLTLFLGAICYWSVGQTPEVTRQQAIRAAESFIQANGYTAKPAQPARLQHELFDGHMKDDRAVLKARRNQLHPKAFCLLQDSDSWHIGFLATSVALSKLSATQKQADLEGRAVTVNKRTKAVRMAHSTPLFSLFEKL